MGAAVVPIWANQPNSTHHLYHFSSASTTQTPDLLTSPFGTSSISIHPGTGSAGWQDPAGEFTSPGINDDGAWDLANSGYIDITLPIAAGAASPGTEYRIDFVIYVTGLAGIVSLPALDDLGLSEHDLVVQNSTGPTDGLGRWDSRTWTGYYDGINSNSITLRIQAPPGGSVIDTLEIYTNLTVVPEPSAALLTVAAGLAGCLRRRRN